MPYDGDMGILIVQVTYGIWPAGAARKEALELLQVQGHQGMSDHDVDDGSVLLLLPPMVVQRAPIRETEHVGLGNSCCFLLLRIPDFKSPFQPVPSLSCPDSSRADRTMKAVFLSARRLSVYARILAPASSSDGFVSATRLLGA